LTDEAPVQLIFNFKQAISAKRGLAKIATGESISGKRTRLYPKRRHLILHPFSPRMIPVFGAAGQ
jgi:hypothetical protein